MSPITTRAAYERGISRRRLYSASFRQLLHGVHVPADESVTIQTWDAAARLVLPDDAQPTGITALQLAGLDLGQPLPLHFATGSNARCERPEVRLHGYGPGEVTLSMALAEYCSAATLMDGVIVADRVMHLGIASPTEVASMQHHSARQVRKVAQLARPGAESPQETRTRLCLVLAGLPEPGLQIVVRDGGRFVGRFDMGYDDYGLLIEYEGDQHRSDKRQWSADILREERARQLGSTVVRITGELFRDPWSQAIRVHQELVRLGYRGPGPSRTPAWEHAFGSVRLRVVA
ncbi:MAG: hypothetical protein WBL05_09675 [Brooklawnia sp.]|uniref:hypothetical protein n=1 Tax=Brooklawnia sp. TaxID=2699740 RepID=UPI003C71CB57